MILNLAIMVLAIRWRIQVRASSQTAASSAQTPREGQLSTSKSFDATSTFYNSIGRFGSLQAWLQVYRDPKAHWDLHQLGEELTELERQNQASSQQTWIPDQVRDDESLKFLL